MATERTTELGSTARTNELLAEAEAQTGIDAPRFKDPVNQGTISAQGIEEARPITIPDQPQPKKSNAFIASTVIPEEVDPAQEQERRTQQANTSSQFSELVGEFNQNKAIFQELGQDKLVGLMEDLQGRGAFTQELENDAGIDEKTIAKNEIDSQIRATNLRFTREQERIENRPGNAAQKQAEMNDVSRKQSRELADLSIIQATRRDDLTTAQALVDRKVELHFEPIEQALEFQTFMYNENKDLFNKVEQRQFEENQAEKQVEIDKDKFKFEQLEQLKVKFMLNAAEAGKGNAYLQSIQGATTEEELLGISGIQGFANSSIEKLDLAIKGNQLLSIQQTAELQRQDIANGILSDKDVKAIDASPQGKSLKAQGDLKIKMNRYQDLVDEVGTESFGTDKAKLDNAYKELQLSFKEAANLGVLAGPDMDIIEAAIADATPGFWRSTLNIGTLGVGSALQAKNVKANLVEGQRSLDSNARLNFEQISARNPSYENSQYVQSLTKPFNNFSEESPIEYDENGNVIIGKPEDETNSEFFNK